MGRISEQEQEAIETRLLHNRKFREDIEIAESEMLDDYLNEGLSEDERLQFERRFLSTAIGRRKISFARALKRHSAKAVDTERAETPFVNRRELHPVKRFMTSRWAHAAAFVLLVLSIGMGVWRVFIFQSDVTKGMIALNAAYRDERPVEVRISDLNYAPFSRTRGAELTKVNRAEFDRAETFLRHAVAEEAGAVSHQALGRFYLLSHNYEKAIEQLEQALKSDPENAQAHSDMGAVLLEQGKIEQLSEKSGQSVEQFAHSLEELNKALALDNTLLEALFNRALCYEYMVLPQQAQDAWRQYIERDPYSYWTIEAKQHLKLLEEQQNKRSQIEGRSLQEFLTAYQAGNHDGAWSIVSQNSTSAGNLITNTLLDTYLALESTGEKENAREQLGALLYVGRLEAERTGDRYTTDLSNFYRQTSASERLLLAQAREQMKKGYERFKQSGFNEAINLYMAAKQTFVQTGNEAEAIFAEYRIGHCYVLKPDTDKSLPLFQALSSICEQRQYKWLLAQCFYEIAHIRVSLSEYSAAIDSSNQALKLSTQLQDTNGLLKSLIQMADAYQSLNQTKVSLGLLQRSLTLLNNSAPEPMQAWGIYFATALNCKSLGFYTAALEYQRETLRLALTIKRPLPISRSYEYLGLVLSDLKHHDEAIKNIQLAYETGKAVSGEPNGLELMASSSLSIGDVYRQMGNHKLALEAYRESIQLYDSLEFQYFNCAAHKGMLLSYIAEGDYASAKRELETVLQLFEQYRSTITDGSHRDSFFDTEQSIYDVAIDFEYSKMNNPHQAFMYSEISRARSLLDILRQGARVIEKENGPDLNLPAVSNPPTIQELQRDLPAQSQLLQYAILDDKLLIWVVTKTDVSSAVIHIDDKILHEQVQDYLNVVKSKSAVNAREVSKRAKDLYAILIKPAEPYLNENHLLCIIPDKILSYLPFSSLISPISGKYLLEIYRLELSPSSSIFLDCSNKAYILAKTADERLLSVGNPSIDRSQFPSLPDLPSAAREAETITAYYKSWRLFLRDDARVKTIKDEIKEADIVEFALHYVIDERSEMLSKLVLAKEPSGTTPGQALGGALPAYEIYKMTLPRTRLVVLSACQTGIEHAYRGEGSVGLARPFMAAGVPLVIASLWAVDSDSSAELMIEFHKQRSLNRLPTAEALRRAQLNMLHGQNELYHQPYYWASFVTIGGYADF